jgi:hypothetical protein
MKYLRLLKKYFFLFVSATLFGLAAVKLSSANAKERKANDKIRELTQDKIDVTDEEINASVDSLKKRQRKNREAKVNAIKKLDGIANGSGSVKSLLNEYNNRL